MQAVKMPEGKDVLSARLFLIVKSLSDREKERRKGSRSEESGGWGNGRKLREKEDAVGEKQPGESQGKRAAGTERGKLSERGGG